MARLTWRPFGLLVSTRTHGFEVEKPSSADGTNYSHSPFRWYFDANLAEFKALRDEMLILKQQVERTFLYMLTTSAAIIASQVVSTTISAYLASHPTLYLALALLVLWFPAHVFTLNVDITTVGQYIRETLEPSLRDLAAAATAGRSETDEHEGSQASVHGPLGWEEFLTNARIGGSQYGYAIAPMYIIKNAFLYAPAVLLLILYTIQSPGVSRWDWPLLALLALLGFTFAAAYIGRGGLWAFARRIGVFRSSQQVPALRTHDVGDR